MKCEGAQQEMRVGDGVTVLKEATTRNSVGLINNPVCFTDPECSVMRLCCCWQRPDLWRWASALSDRTASSCAEFRYLQGEAGVAQWTSCENAADFTAYIDGSAKIRPFKRVCSSYSFSDCLPAFSRFSSFMFCYFSKISVFRGKKKKNLLFMRAGERLINADESLLSCTSVSGEAVIWVCMQTALAVSTHDSVLQHSLPSQSWKLGFPSSV